MIDGNDRHWGQIGVSVGGIDGQKTMTEQWQEHKPKEVQELSLEFVSQQHAHQ